MIAILKSFRRINLMKQAKYAIFSLLFVVFCGLHPAVAWAAEGGAALN